jgi:predicted AAA+ superfamily ATPase
MGGAIFETAVITEIFKSLAHRGQEPQMYFWRTASGSEVDLVVDIGVQLIPIEIKLTATPHPGLAAGINSFQQELARRAGAGYVVHPGDVKLPLAPKVTALPLTEL